MERKLIIHRGEGVALTTDKSSEKRTGTTGNKTRAEEVSI
jgi:hypothetical protein